jgi:hypothetical protein
MEADVTQSGTPTVLQHITEPPIRGGLSGFVSGSRGIRETSARPSYGYL